MKPPSGQGRVESKHVAAWQLEAMARCTVLQHGLAFTLISDAAVCITMLSAPQHTKPQENTMTRNKILALTK
eukprot:CAMPEP_0174348024 /NCGR_PEP_ID=MMETSP0811_2-20130205/4332_1 /TAXON_ID=73025 ORGANISM="Eutreptiella gymnastica-like, Strain CCMP1594" /NCGR_SAMPLE_ID=MMETSP0811_2 /ASSEMBLY_ACC=CAM_ASM_000667 /LENGTH=71 /DNA_ID=CAMNT_0015474171 /DNA_START=92 /DNA_END=307 /DNA_ORIENTATION=+